MSTSVNQSINDLPLDDSFGAAPRSRVLIIRTFVIYFCIMALGLLPSVLGLDAIWQVAGLGLVFPGGGFVALGGWWVLLFPITVALMLASCALWQLMANVFAPLFFWIGSLVLATALAGTEAWQPSVIIVPLSALLFLAWAYAKTQAISKREMVNRDVRNAYLPEAERAVVERAQPEPVPGTRELTPEQLAHLRYVLDRGLQEVENLGGFDVIEQFQTSAIRYQINNLLWALQVAQCHYTPNFHGYLSQAQCNLIDKLTLPKAWRWWRWESLLGNFSFNRDPIAKDNIMFGGFSSANVALYTATTGDDRYLRDGSLNFVDSSGKCYSHSLKTLLENGRYNQEIATYGPMYPCEPTLTYSACNVWGHVQHIVGDRILGTDYHPGMIEKLRYGHITEMMTHDGVPHSGRVNPLGIRLPVYSCNMVSALWGWIASCFFPDLSRRVWAILRHEYVDFDDNGDIDITTFAYDRIDTGNYKKSEAGLYAHMLVYAQEQGDAEVANGIMNKFNRDFARKDKDGIVSYDISNREMGAYVMGVLMATGDVRNMVHKGPPQTALRGPILSAAKYPDVLVAKAFSHGDDLELVLYPGSTQRRQHIEVSRLVPEKAYQVTGLEGYGPLIADSDGRISLEIELEGRTQFSVIPA
jgi:Linalool dehydratase/isomerase